MPTEIRSERPVVPSIPPADVQHTPRRLHLDGEDPPEETPIGLASLPFLLVVGAALLLLGLLVAFLTWRDGV